MVRRGGAKVYPSYHVLRGHMALRSAEVLETAITAPRDAGLGGSHGDGLQVWLANLTGTRQRVRLQGQLDGLAEPKLHLIDEDSFETLSRIRTVFKASAGRPMWGHRRAAALRGGDARRALGYARRSSVGQLR